MSCQSENPAYPAHAPDTREDEGEDDKPLVRPTTRKEPHEEVRDQAIDDEDLATFGSSETFETSSDSTVTEKRWTTSMAGFNCFSGTRGVKGLAGARRGDLDFGQNVTR